MPHSSNKAGDYLTLDDQFRLFVWALWQAELFDQEEAKRALKFIRRVRDENIPIKAGLKDCASIETGSAVDGEKSGGSDQDAP